MRKVVVARRKPGFSEVKMSHPFFSSSNPDTPREIGGGGGEKGNRGQDSLPVAGAGYKRTLPATPEDWSFIGSTRIYLYSWVL